MSCCYGDWHVINTERICTLCYNLSVGPGAVLLDGMRATEQRTCLPAKKVTMEWINNYLRQKIETIINNCSPKWRWIVVDICRAPKREAISFVFGCSEVTSELANQCARKALFACVVYTKSQYSKRNHTSLSSGSPILFKLKFGDVDFCARRKSRK